jgi:hypothetical protein
MPQLGRLTTSKVLADHVRGSLAARQFTVYLGSISITIMKFLAFTIARC